MDAPVYLSYTRNFGAPRRPQADFFFFLAPFSTAESTKKDLCISKDFLYPLKRQCHEIFGI